MYRRGVAMGDEVWRKGWSMSGSGLGRRRRRAQDEQIILGGCLLGDRMYVQYVGFRKMFFTADGIEVRLKTKFQKSKIKNRKNQKSKIKNQKSKKSKIENRKIENRKLKIEN